MNLAKAIEKAYMYNQKVGRKKIYWAVDIHDTIAQSNYANEMPSVISKAMSVLNRIKEFPETVLILYSCSYNHEAYIEYFKTHGVEFTYFNENPEICDTSTGDFSKKFYYNVLLDDKAGFEDSDWDTVLGGTLISRVKYPLE